MDAIKTAAITDLNRNTINAIFNGIREKIFLFCNANETFSGEIELDESYFGAKRVRGKRGRGAAGKTPVFGVFKRDGNVYVEIVKNYSKEQLMPIIQGNA